MLKMEVKKLLNEQINKELYSAYLYLSIADYYAQKNLNGFENWFLVQAKEEQDHAMLIRQYLHLNVARLRQVCLQIDAAVAKRQFRFATHQ